MTQINMASADLSELVKLIESGQEDRIVIERDGKPVVKMESCRDEPNGQNIKFGIAKGELEYTGDFDECNNEIAELFGVAP